MNCDICGNSNETMLSIHIEHAMVWNRNKPPTEVWDLGLYGEWNFCSWACFDAVFETARELSGLRQSNTDNDVPLTEDTEVDGPTV